MRKNENWKQSFLLVHKPKNCLTNIYVRLAFDNYIVRLINMTVFTSEAFTFYKSTSVCLTR